MSEKGLEGRAFWNLRLAWPGVFCYYGGMDTIFISFSIEKLIWFIDDCSS
jgi:hypothetical protein